MSKCFLFINSLQENSYLSLGLDSQGHIKEELTLRNADSIKTLQYNADTIVVLSTSLSSLHTVDLPCLVEKKAQAAIPFALEEKLAQNITSQHFAFDKNHYQDGKYLVSVIDKSFLRELIAKLNKEGIIFHTITLDWFALSPNEMAVCDDYLLINTETFQGALSQDLVSLYFSSSQYSSSNLSCYHFSNKNSDLLQQTSLKIIKINEHYYHWIASRLQAINPLNLCQGEFEQGDLQQAVKRWYIAAFTMGFLCILAFILHHGTKIHSFHKEMHNLDTEIAHIYHEFFPQATQVISPKFRITQLLKTNQLSQQNNFWILLNALAKILNSDDKIRQINYQNNMIMLTLALENFQRLENIQEALQKINIKVKQTQALMENHQIIGTLELSL